MEPLIVGIDPGSTSAVAAFNLDGELELIESRREFPQDEIIQEIIQTGKPVIISSDKANMPSTVDKIASSLGSKRFRPEKDLKTERKKRIGEGSNSHERDAYAAALHAYKNMDKTIRKINNHSEQYKLKRLDVAEAYLSEKPGFETDK